MCACAREGPRYVAYRVESPTCNAIRGRPPAVSTNATRSKLIVTSIRSPRRYVSPSTGALNAAHRACGAPTRPPSTLYPVGSLPRDSTAGVVSPSRVIEPPFADNPFALMLTPSASRSPACTT